MNLHLSQFAAVHAPFAPATPAPRRGAAGLLAVFAEPFARILARLAAASRRAQDTAFLHGLNDRELADMGLGRADIGRIHDPGFAAEHAARRQRG
jgi:uncharacterized protein YjiS (DUF1127 family)